MAYILLRTQWHFRVAGLYNQGGETSAAAAATTVRLEPVQTVAKPNSQRPATVQETDEKNSPPALAAQAEK